MGRSLGALITRRLAEMERTQTALRSELERAGVPLTRQSLHNWTVNARRPGAAHMLALLDVLLIPESERREWFEAQARPVGTDEDTPTEHA